MPIWPLRDSVFETEFFYFVNNSTTVNNFPILIYWEILNIGTEGWIFLSNFCKFTHKVFFDFSFFYIFSEKRIYPSQVCLPNDEKKSNFSSISQCSQNYREICSQKRNIHLKQVWIWRIHLRKNHGVKPHCVFKQVSEIYSYLNFIDISWYDGHGTSAEILQFYHNG